MSNLLGILTGALIGLSGVVGLETMRKQYHFWPGEGGRMDAWDVDHLIGLVADLPVEEVALCDLPEIDSEYWFDEWERPTVRKVIEHLRLVGEVDPSYPIILGPDNRVMDGMHRVARALLDGRRAITARRFRELPEPDYRGCRPDELPWFKPTWAHPVGTLTPLPSRGHDNTRRQRSAALCITYRDTIQACRQRSASASTRRPCVH